MPDKDGYEVCQFVKQHPQFGSKPVILMSGVVNRTVAEKAMEVKADELIRKPFQPQELIARVKALLKLEAPVPVTAPAVEASPLSGIFAGARAGAPHTNFAFHRRLRDLHGTRGSSRRSARGGERAASIGSAFGRSAEIETRDCAARYAGEEAAGRT